MHKMKILVVDDHALLRDGIRALLDLYDDTEIAGEASDGKEAIEKVKEVHPDVVIMDIGMPVMDGLEATRRIKKRNPQVKILILTQHSNREYVLSAIKAGANGYIPKRAIASELVSAIRNVYQGESFLHPSVARVVIEEYVQQAQKDSFDNLTEREREILKLVADGYSSRQIADMLYISSRTVSGHRDRIMNKLDIHNRSELIKYAIRKGLADISIKN